MIADKKFYLQRAVVLLALLLLSSVSFSQPFLKEYKIRDGNMYILLSKNLPDASLDSFITQYNLDEMALKKVIRNNAPDSLIKAGWKLEINNSELLALSKKFGGVGDFKDPSISISITDKLSDEINNFPAVSSLVKYGVNRFRNKSLFAIHDSTVTFFLRGNTRARKVVLAGSFNNWSTNSLYMTPTDSGWVADVKIGAGKYWYKFIIDDHWDIDRDNRITENDGRGNDNSVFYKPNFFFRSTAFRDNKQLYVAGSFNNWNPNELPLTKTGNGWALALYLAEGTYTYRYIADGRWYEDPENRDHFPNELGEYNSVVRLGKAYTFRLPGFTDAGKVTMVGSFNKWRDDELILTRTGDGWEFYYTLGPGNYQYAFKVNGKWVTADQAGLTNDANRAGYQHFIIDPNYTFRLKGYSTAKKVFIGGDFNNWSRDTYPMKKEGDDWIINLHLDKGKHLYKFIVDGQWIIDPGNKLWEQNEYSNGNSILWVE